MEVDPTRAAGGEIEPPALEHEREQGRVRDHPLDERVAAGRETIARSVDALLEARARAVAADAFAEAVDDGGGGEAPQAGRAEGRADREGASRIEGAGRVTRELPVAHAGLDHADVCVAAHSPIGSASGVTRTGRTDHRGRGGPASVDGSGVEGRAKGAMPSGMKHLACCILVPLLFAGGGCGGCGRSGSSGSARAARTGAPTGNPNLPGVAQVDRSLERHLRAALADRSTDFAPRSTPNAGAAEKPRYVNRLVLETSPYLLAHATEPIDWYPWGDAAFTRAKREHRPILLSIGFATCHWCHVMEHESFDDPKVAAFVNAHFVAIAVDREERPDVDAVYMHAVEMMTGGGGWPMTLVLTPDGRPFFAATYLPAHEGERGAAQGLLTILKGLAQRFETGGIPSSGRLAPSAHASPRSLHRSGRATCRAAGCCVPQRPRSCRASMGPTAASAERPSSPSPLVSSS